MHIDIHSSAARGSGNVLSIPCRQQTHPPCKCSDTSIDILNLMKVLWSRRETRVSSTSYLSGQIREKRNTVYIGKDENDRSNPVKIGGKWWGEWLQMVNNELNKYRIAERLKRKTAKCVPQVPDIVIYGDIKAAFIKIMAVNGSFRQTHGSSATWIYFIFTSVVTQCTFLTTYMTILLHGKRGGYNSMECYPSQVK